jgi:hypothetical protein
MKKFLLLFFVLIHFLFSAELVETPYTIEDANLRVLKILNKITDNSIKPVEKTSGFNYRYKSNFFSPFRFDIYVGKFSRKSDDSLIRVEATKNGEAKVFKNILDVELNHSENTYKFSQNFSSKYHIVSQTLNVATPMFSVLYNSYNSPFYTWNDAASKSVTYFLIDLLIVGIAAFYINNSNVGDKSQLDDLFLRKGPSKELIAPPHGGVVLAALAIPRLYRSIEAFHDTSAQNRMAELSYTFRY